MFGRREDTDRYETLYQFLSTIADALTPSTETV